MLQKNATRLFWFPLKVINFNKQRCCKKMKNKKELKSMVNVLIDKTNF